MIVIPRLLPHLLTVAGMAAVSGCSSNDSAPPASPAPPASASMRQAVPVSVATAARRDVPDTVLAIGSVEPIATVMVKPQVDGQLLEARFAEGQDLHAGDLILMLDSRPYEAQLAEAQANLAKDTAVAQDLERVAQQMAEARKSGASSQREVDKARADADAAQAQVQSDIAAVSAARLLLEYCSIKSPITGSAGSLLIKPGNVVKENESELVQINQISPIVVSFSVPEQNLGRIKDHQAIAPLAMEVGIPGDAGPVVSGSLVFIDNKVDSTTGTFRLKGTFANNDRRLWPGQFVTGQTLRVDGGVTAGINWPIEL